MESIERSVEASSGFRADEFVPTQALEEPTQALKELSQIAQDADRQYGSQSEWQDREPLSASETWARISWPGRWL